MLIGVLGIIVSAVGRAGYIDLDGAINGIVVAVLDYFNVSANTRENLLNAFYAVVISTICYFTYKRFLRERAEARRENKPWKRWFLRVLCLVVCLPYIFVIGMVFIKS
ncbi:hypothetical protein [Thalassotalea sp. Y01]|uniref:hypothetical protein n=1 Tax=Thalassotalea sp. Y01 TaxID=2729613 RepID=UPI00145CF2A7|nr:hypothetical protein [Thalassotalea sp. Y01]NMP15365.1 hypothetical protein [Thalassotalea sp. Y01]